MGAISRWIDRLFAKVNLGWQKPNNQAFQGHKAEQLAADYLQQHGLTLLQSNYRTKAGEIDLVMRGEGVLVFVEVRHRNRSDWAHAAESVTFAKQQKVIKAAKMYCLQRRYNGRCRFDVVAIDGPLAEAEIKWFEHAFY